MGGHGLLQRGFHMRSCVVDQPKKMTRKILKSTISPTMPSACVGSRPLATPL